MGLIARLWKPSQILTLFVSEILKKRHAGWILFATCPAQILNVIVPLIRYFQNHFYCPFGSALMRYVLLIRRFKMGSLVKAFNKPWLLIKWSCGTTSKLSYSNSSFRAVFASISMSHFKCFVSWPSSSKLSLILVFEL